jgi:hypothetical protein
MLRRGLALGGGLIVLILIVLGVKGCLDARANRQLSDYARSVTQIVEETDQTSKSLFGKFEDPGKLTVTDFVDEVQADRSAMDNYASRVAGLGAPGDMGTAQHNLELVYQLRSSAMTEIAAKMSTALGEAGAPKATAGIAKQMQKLLAGDVVYETVVRPEIDGVLEANGIEGDEVPKSSFLPDSKWLEESTVASALGSVSGSSSTAAAGPGVHGLGLIAVSMNGNELGEGSIVVLEEEETPEVEVQVQNQGESAENGVTVSVSVNGGSTLQQSISTIEAGETATTTIPLTPAPKGTVTLEVEVEPVPGEQVSSNNEASYSVTIE